MYLPDRATGIQMHQVNAYKPCQSVNAVVLPNTSVIVVKLGVPSTICTYMYYTNLYNTIYTYILLHPDMFGLVVSKACPPCK